MVDGELELSCIIGQLQREPEYERVLGGIYKAISNIRQCCLTIYLKTGLCRSKIKTKHISIYYCHDVFLCWSMYMR